MDFPGDHFHETQSCNWPYFISYILKSYDNWNIGICARQRMHIYRAIE